MLSIAKLFKRCFVWILTGSPTCVKRFMGIRPTHRLWPLVLCLGVARFCFNNLSFTGPSGHPVFFFGGGEGAVKNLVVVISMLG